jgi:predicted metal-binding protein
MSDRQGLEALFEAHGYADYRWIDPGDIVVAQWVRMKCMFGCGEYGQNAACPPNTPSVSECRQFFGEYRTATVFRFEKVVEKPKDRHAWSRDERAFLLFMDSCELCSKCEGAREECKHPRSARPSPEAMAMDVFSTVKKIGYPIEVLADYDRAMNRYAFLLIE